MLFARKAYSRVDKVSSKLDFTGEIVAIMQVFVRPPKESWSRRVSLDSLKEETDE